MKNKIEKEVLKETEDCGGCLYMNECSYDREEREKTRHCDKRIIKLTQQKTAQAIFDDMLKKSIVCNDKLCNAPCCISFQNLKKKHGVK